MVGATVLTERVEDAQKAGAGVDDIQVLDTAPTTLEKVDSAWVIDFVAPQSDLTVEALIKASSFDERAPLQILLFGLKATRTLKLPLGCRVKEVLAKVLKERLGAVGDRIAHMKPMLVAKGKVEVGDRRLQVQGWRP